MEGQQLSPAPKKTIDMAEAIPKRAKMANSINAGSLILVDKIGKEEIDLRRWDPLFSFWFQGRYGQWVESCAFPTTVQDDVRLIEAGLLSLQVAVGKRCRSRLEGATEPSICSM